MSWRDSLQPGSFRGVPFLIDAAHTQVGRRVALHEYPLQDKPWAEDLGRRARRFEVDCLVLGADYMTARDALMTALEQNGAGTLVHPYYGTRSVVVVDAVTVDESMREGGMARLRIPFAESGEMLQPSTSTDTSAVVNGAAAGAQQAVVADFAGGFSVSPAPAWVGASALDDLTGLTTRLAQIRDSIPGIPDSVTAFNTLLQGFSNTLQALIETPFDLGAGIMGLVIGVGTLVQQPLDALGLYSQLGSFGSVTNAPSAATPARAQAANNHAALVALVRGLATANAAATTAAVPAQTQTIVQPASLGASGAAASGATSTPVLIDASDADATLLSTATTITGYATSNAAATARDAVTDLIDTLCLTAADDVYTALRDLRAAVVSDLNARMAVLPSLETLVLPRTTPALVLAWRLYADAKRDAEVIGRNAVVNPGFVPDGVPLEVLSE